MTEVLLKTFEPCQSGTLQMVTPSRERLEITSHQITKAGHILDTAISFDCLQVCNLACFELLVRRKQLIAEAHQFNPSNLSYEGAEFWMGSRYKSGGAIVVPALTEHVAKQLQAESQILKERRKLAEAKGTGRGGGPGKPPNAGPKGGPQAAGSSN